MQQQPLAPTQTAAGSPGDETTEAPPKQMALAMDRLNQAGRLIADIRIGADRLLEALFSTGSVPHNQIYKPLQLILKEETSMRQHLQDLRNVGRQLEESGVLNDSLRARSNSWGLHMPLVCPDAAVVAAYAWKRQLAGQAGASAVDRTRLALEAFSDQKRRFFPHLDDDSSGEPSKKKSCSPVVSQEPHEKRTVSDTLKLVEKEFPDVKIFTYQRLDWLKRAAVLPSEGSLEPSKEHAFHNPLTEGSTSNVNENKVAVIELLFPSIFRAVVSLHPAGLIDPDAVAFFSPDEGGSYVHARGVSVHHVFKRITEHASIALQYFSGLGSESVLHTLLHWICSYRTLLTKACSKCGRLLSMDKQSGLLLPAVNRPYRNFTGGDDLPSTEDRGVDLEARAAFHVGCFSEEA